jgi:hypothetical protein
MPKLAVTAIKEPKPAAQFKPPVVSDFSFL